MKYILSSFKFICRLLYVLTLGSTTSKCRVMIRLLKYVRSKGMFTLARFLSDRLQHFGMHISPNAELGEGVRFPHPIAIVIGSGVKIGNNVTIYQSVTLGGKEIGDSLCGNYPVVGDGTIIFAGAVVIGNITIGRNCKIGANSVVLKSVPDNSTAVGCPAKILIH
jgi:serine O-acetyltransferase